MYLLICVVNKDSNQSVHGRSLISFRCPHEETLRLWLSKLGMLSELAAETGPHSIKNGPRKFKVQFSSFIRNKE